MATLQPGEQSRMYALGKIARGGAVRGGYVDGRVYIALAGSYHVGFGRTDPAVGTIIDSLQITDILDEQPNSCRFRIHGAVASVGDAVRVTLGSKNATMPLFAGHALTVQQLYAADNPANVQSEVSAVDYTWLLGNLLITKAYRNQSATAIAHDLVATAAGNGFTSGGVATNLPALNEITYTNEPLPGALTRLARRIGAYWYVDGNKNVHLFFTEPQRPDPEPLTPTHRSFAHFRREQDRTQTLTRVYVEGRGSTVLGAVAAGDTLIPLAAVDMFEAVASDVFVKVSPQGSEGGSQHLAYLGVVPGGLGALVGPGIGPSAAPELALQNGAGLEAGAHGYAVTFVTPSGESLAGPVAMITPGLAANPTAAPTATFFQTPIGNGNIMTIGDTVQFAYAYVTDAGSTLASSPSASYVLPSNNDPLNTLAVAGINLYAPYSPDPRVTSITFYIYSATVTQEWRRFSTGWTNNPAGGTLLATIMGTGYGATGFPLPPTNTTGQNQVVVSGIAIGSSSVTQRKLYRTAANQSQLKLLTTIANNTATTHTDTAADATLGANVPVTDTSGLQQPPGQVLPGSTSLVVAGTAAFQATGGWASIGNGEQEIRYTGLTAGSLSGIPASGIGSITAAIAYNSTVTASPMLTGIATITAPLTRGDELYLVVQVDDANRQTELAADVGGDGVREEWVQDRRLSIAEARARGQATLQVRPLDQERITYTCRDLRTAAGTTIQVNLPPPTNVSGYYKIQQVTISNFRPHPTQYPTYTVEASSSRFSFENWLRVIRTKE